MALNAAGEMVEEWWNKIPEKFPDIELGEFQIMPNHFHAIPATGDENKNSTECVMADPGVNLADRRVGPPEITDFSNQGEHTGSPLHRVVQWFKTMTTNEFIRNVKFPGWEPFENKIWQRNYYEHIIRNDDSYRRIANYIVKNPQNWQEDEYFPARD